MSVFTIGFPTKKTFEIKKKLCVYFWSVDFRKSFRTPSTTATKNVKKRLWFCEDWPKRLPKCSHTSLVTRRTNHVTHSRVYTLFHTPPCINPHTFENRQIYIKRFNCIIPQTRCATLSTYTYICMLGFYRLRRRSTRLITVGYPGTAAGQI